MTTVENFEGSVWRDAAFLREEASIGEARGRDEYMFGQIRGIAATENRIFVLDGQVRTVRVFDFNGQHVMDIGGRGEGPGEFSSPSDIAVSADGRVFVRDRTRISVFDLAGVLIETWAIGRVSDIALRMTATTEGLLYNPQYLSLLEKGVVRTAALVAYDQRGVPKGPPLMLPEGAEAGYLSNSEGRIRSVPFWPRAEWALTPLGTLVHGTPDEYAFRIETPRSEEATVVTRSVAATPIGAEEAAYWKRRITAALRVDDPTWAWNGPDIPGTKPFFDDLYGDGKGRVWVNRSGPSEKVVGCDLAALRGPSCWRSDSRIDVFDAGGRYLGDLTLPLRFSFDRAFCVYGDDVLVWLVDEEGTFIVKRYRLVAPTIN